MSKPDFVEVDLLAPAKINLGLDVRRNIVDGRHPLSTVMQSVSLYDRLHFEADWDPANAGIQIEMCFGRGVDSDDVPLEENLVYKAIMCFCDHIGKPMGDRVRIRLEKNIPTRSGLGGGSSDCAAAIKMMARLYGLDANGAEAVAVARKLGSDVAFFLEGGCALLGGFGDVMGSRFKSPHLDIVIARPSEGLSTPEVYKAFDAMEESIDFECADRSQSELLRQLEAGGSAASIAPVVGNSLQPAACFLNPGVEEVIARFGECSGVLGASVSGSGSACYAIFESSHAASEAAERMEQAGFWSVACESIPSENVSCDTGR